MDAGGALGEVAVDVYADLSRLETDFNKARSASEKVSKDIEGTIGKSAKKAKSDMAGLDRATRDLAKSYSPLHTAQIRLVDDLEKINKLYKANVFSAGEAAMFTDKATAAYKRSTLEMTKTHQWGQKAGEAMKRYGALASAALITVGAALIKNAIQSADAIQNQSRQLGLSAEEFQKWQYVATQSGVKAGAFQQAIEQLQNTMGKVATGSKEDAELFRALGVDLNDASGKAKSTNAILLELADRLQEVGDKNQRATALQKLFGMSGAELSAMLAGGSQGVKNLGDEIERLGGVLSEKEIADLAETNKKFEQLKNTLSTDFSHAVAKNAESITSLAGSITTLLGEVIKLIDDWPRLTAMLGGAALGSKFGLIGAAGGAVAGAVGYGAIKESSRIAADERDMDPFSRMKKAVAAQKAFETANASWINHLTESGNTLIQVTKAEADRTRALYIQSITAKRSAAETKAATGKNRDLSGLNKPDGSTARTAAQILVDFKRELASRGVVVISDFRTAADQNKQFKAGLTPLSGYGPGNISRHQSREAVDVDKRTHDDAKAYEAAMAAGLKKFEIVTESGGRKHYEWKGAGKPGEVDVAGSEAAMREEEQNRKRAAREAEQARMQKLQQEKRFASQLGQFQDAELQAQLGEATDAETIAQIRAEQVKREHDRYNDELKNMVGRKEITAPQADALKVANEAQRAIDLDRIDSQKRHDLREAENDIAAAKVDNEIEMLQSSQELAKTDAERNLISGQILDLTFQQRHAALTRVAFDTTLDKTVREKARLELEMLGLLEDQAREAHRRASMNPVEKFYDALDRTTKAIDELYLDFAAQKLEDRIAASGQMADDIAGAFGDVARGLLTLQDPIDLLKNLLFSLAKIFQEEVLVKPLEKWVRKEIGAPVAEKVTGFGAGPGGLTVKQMADAAGRAAPMLDALKESARNAAAALNSVQAGGTSALAGDIAGGGAGSGTPKVIQDLMNEGPIAGGDIATSLLDLGQAAAKTTTELGQFGGALPQVIQQLLAAAPVGGGGGGILGAVLGIAGAALGGMSAGGIARSNMTVGATIASNPGIFHDGGEIGANGRPVRRPLRAGEVNITAKVGERVIKEGPSKKFGRELDSINAGRLMQMPTINMPMMRPVGGGGSSLSVNLGGIHINGGAGDDRSSRRSAKIIAAEVNQQIARAAKTGVARRD